MQLPLLSAAGAVVASLATLASESPSSSATNLSTSTAAFTQQCDALASTIRIPNATVWFSEYVAAGNLSLPDYNATCGDQLVDVYTGFCRVVLHVATRAQSGISMETWLPVNWTGRFLSTGNGGFNGCIQYSDLAYATELGFATVGANNGHNGSSKAGLWAFQNNPGVIEDSAWRSIHTNVVVGQAITQQFYGTPHTKSYYLGCSTGGCQGWKAAQSFPGDFDALQAWSAHFYLLTGPPNSTQFVRADVWETVIHADVLAQCDGLDGYVDGILEDPRLCSYRPEGLLCPSDATNTSLCLTGAQADMMRKVYEPLYSEDGVLIFPHQQPGGELMGAVEAFCTGTLAEQLDDIAWYQYAIFNDTTWDLTKAGPKDWAAGIAANPSDIDKWHGDLSGARDRGAKILHSGIICCSPAAYHGLADSVISGENSARYYDHVSRTMGLSNQELDDFYRLFRISGMGYCLEWPGATFIGNLRENTAPLDPDENVLTAVERWVEEGIAPETVTGTAFVNQTQNGEVVFKRAHCRYPYRNYYKGTGDPTDPASWNCIV